MLFQKLLYSLCRQYMMRYVMEYFNLVQAKRDVTRYTAWSITDYVTRHVPFSYVIVSRANHLPNRPCSPERHFRLFLFYLRLQIRLPSIPTKPSYHDSFIELQVQDLVCTNIFSDFNI